MQRYVLVIVDPDTGEQIDLHALTDRELDALHLDLNFRKEEYTRLERDAWRLLNQRAVERGGLVGATRKWTVERRTYMAATVEQTGRATK